MIRPYRETDHAAVYDVCVRTADAGGDARGKYHTDDLMPDLFAGPYVFLEPEFAFVLDDGNRAVGYVIGTPDTAAFARAYRARWIPRLAGRYPVPPDPPDQPGGGDARPAPPPGAAGLARPGGVPGAPAHRPAAAVPGAGHGRALMETFYAAAARAGAAGVHVTVTTANTRALGFYDRLGFRRLEITEPGETTVTVLGRRL